jgi:hypothetical protein
MNINRAAMDAAPAIRHPVMRQLPRFFTPFGPIPRVGRQPIAGLLDLAMIVVPQPEAGFMD